jgi:hypothetical protein
VQDVALLDGGRSAPMTLSLWLSRDAPTSSLAPTFVMKFIVAFDNGDLSSYPRAKEL